MSKRDVQVSKPSGAKESNVSKQRSISRSLSPKKEINKSQQKTIKSDIVRLVEHAAKISRKAGELIRYVKVSKLLGTSEKGGEGSQDYVTIADIAAQYLIVNSLKAKFKGIRVVGEEGELTKEMFDDQLKELKNKTNKETDPSFFEYIDKNAKTLVDEGDARVLKIADGFENKNQELASADISNFVVWVDPLDGTREYTQGDQYLSEVTVLIGIAYKGRPVAGVINQPFFKKNNATSAAENTNQYDDRILWSIEKLGAYQTVGSGNDEVYKRLDKPPKRDEIVIVSSRAHNNKAVEEFFASIKGSKLLKCGGCGYKSLCLIDGTGDVYLYPRAGTKRWDTCAPEAILQEMGITWTNIDGNKFDYSEPKQLPDGLQLPHGEDPQILNIQGIIASFYNHNIYMDYLKRPVDVKIPIGHWLIENARKKSNTK